MKTLDKEKSVGKVTDNVFFKITHQKKNVNA